MKTLLLTLILFSAAAFAASSVHEFTMDALNGTPTPLANFKGKVMLVVNVASQCGYTYQYETLQALYAKYKDQGLVLAGFPANNFGGQEPGTNEEIGAFCKSKFGVTFPMFSKISVKGADKAPLYQFLTDKKAVEPNSKEVISAVEAALKAK
jgi:glutathione peroxidase